MRRKIERVLNEVINPEIELHGGRIELVDYVDGVVHVKMEGGCQGCAQQQFFQGLQWPPIDGLLAARGKGVLIALKGPVHAGDIFADDLDLLRSADAQAGFVSQADEVQTHRIKAHHFGGDGIDGYLIGTCKNHILDMGGHAPWAWSVAGKGSIRQSQDTGMNLFLDCE